ncbi:MAG: hypothetical protein R3212_03825 [Xanthomonadales bacterium]|nr:hypothetical protein [Xanthomonadales bacterium]
MLRKLLQGFFTDKTTKFMICGLVTLLCIKGGRNGLSQASGWHFSGNYETNMTDNNHLAGKEFD